VIREARIISSTQPGVILATPTGGSRPATGVRAACPRRS